MKFFLSTVVAISIAVMHQPAIAAPSPTEVGCDFWLLEHPFNTTLKAAPSMRQALDLSSCAYRAGHKGIAILAGDNQRSYEDSIWVRLAIGGYDFFLMSMPLGMGWLHEEWHRNVLSSRDISSYNEVYEFEIGAEVIKVSHISDEEMIRLKKDHNADLVRLGEAGVESSYALNLSMQKDEFYRETAVFNNVAYVLNLLNGIQYISSGSTTDPDRIKEEMNKEEDDPQERDFVGHDFTSWVYDLHRPEEPYEARGAHPSGNGIDRYRGYNDLTDKEQKFMKLQGQLQLLNVIDPFLLGFTKFEHERDGQKYYWNANLRHQLTSFGYSVETNMFLKGTQPASNNWFFSLKGFRNDKKWFPGVEVGLIDYALNTDSAITSKLLTWQQPKEQSFYTDEAVFGGLLGVDYAYKLSQTFDALAGVEAKTEGWAAGNPYLDKNLTLRTGITARL